MNESTAQDILEGRREADRPFASLLVFNRATVDQYTNFDADTAKHLLGVVLKDLPRQLDAVESFVNSANVSEAFRAAHSMKSSAAWIGAEQVQSLAARIERLMHDGMTHDAQSLLIDLRECCRRLIDTIQLATRPENAGGE